MVIQELIITVYQPGVSMKASVKYQLLLQFFFYQFHKKQKNNFQGKYLVLIGQCSVFY